MPACLPLVSFLTGFERAVMNATKFDWSQAKEHGSVLVDAPARKIALFANASHDITLIVEEDGQQVITTIDPDEAVRLSEMLNAAIGMTMAGHRHQEAEYAALGAIHKASDGGAGHA